MTEKTFMKITNKDIYERIEHLIENNTCEHHNILRHQKETNGKVKLNKWIATTALTISMMAIGWVFVILN